MADQQLPMWQRLYMPIAMLFTIFGVVAMFSIGLPFVVLGLAMMALWPLRDRRAVFTSLFVALLAFVAAAILVAPGGCSATATTSGTGGTTTCTNLLGIDYTGAVPYSPPFWPALVAGATAAVVAGSLVFALLRRGRSA